MRMIFPAALVGVVGLGAATVAAQQSDPIRQRQALMKSNQEQMRTLTGMARGQAPFDAAATQAALQQVAQNARQIPALFPPDTNTGETAALPAIWERKADFDARATKLGEDATAAAGRVRDAAGLQADLQVVGQSCGGCHEVYRKKPAQ